ncbi:uncharacterized protein A4U43_C04F25170 [Asparagus officinalis]|uniref:DNL-type domain-containing protein n=1 Tax=Asparagus officinalis TaxID=4686 RepID=A0A5P1F8U8_ASPOF|nr:uncharacterized protein A4U43_C04F25170 [Asparagus officinalis]
MDSLSIPSAIPSPSILSPKRPFISRRPLLLPISSKNKENEPDLGPDSDNTGLVPFFKNPSSLSPLSNVRTSRFGDGFGIERGGRERLGPPAPGPGSDSGDRPVSTFPWSLFTKSPRRRMRVAFTCNVCGQRTTRAINPHAYTDGTVFVQCCGCNVFHKLVDNLNLFHEMKCYVSPSFPYKGNLRFNFLDGDDDDNDENIFPIL